MDTEIVDGFLSELKEYNSQVFVFKLIHIGNQKFYKAFSAFYSKERALSVNEELYIDGIVSEHNIDRYQQERMKIDIMYRHPDNKRVVDEYRDILLSGDTKDTLKHSEFARLRRLRTLGIRNNIPSVLFETLDPVRSPTFLIFDVDTPFFFVYSYLDQSISEEEGRIPYGRARRH